MLKILCCTGLVAMLAPSLCQAGMRCGNKLVSEGDNFADVVNICGEADSTIDMGSKVIYREVRQGAETAAIAESVKQDLWIYNEGPNKFIRNLYFENGILVKIENGKRGN